MNPVFVIGQKAIEAGVSIAHHETVDNGLYRKADIIHCSQPVPTTVTIDKLNKLHLKKPIVCTIHSELEYEKPVVHSSIKKYICIRPSIQEHIVNNYSVDESKCVIVYNPIDLDRFKPIEETVERRTIVFPGTIDYLRRETIFDLYRLAVESGALLKVIGFKYENYLDEIVGSKSENLQVITWPVGNVENHIQYGTETASVLLGRTVLEGWACGKPSWIYDINPEGNILSKELVQPPDSMDLYDSKLVAKSIENIYIEAINSR